MRVSSDEDPLPPVEAGILAAKFHKRELRKFGYGPLIVALTAQGLTPSDIAERIREDHHVDVSPLSVKALLDDMGPMESLQQAAAQQEFAELHMIAIEQLNSMRDEYEQLKGAQASKEVNTRLEMLQRYFIQWWDRVGKFHFRADNVSLTANITQVSITDALAEVKGKPKDAAAVLAKLRGEETGPGASGGA